jgi:hypothetical protein
MAQNQETNAFDDERTVDPLMHLKCASDRTLAISSGDLRSAVLKEVGRMLDENRGHPVKACRAGLSRLVDGKMLSPTEADQLGEICKIVFDRQKNKISFDEASRVIDGIYHPLITKGDASPVALAIASMAANTELPQGESLSAAATRQGGDIGMVGGAIGGAVIGGAIGGAGGAVIGAVVGGIAGGVAGACAD